MLINIYDNLSFKKNIYFLFFFFLLSDLALHDYIKIKPEILSTLWSENGMFWHWVSKHLTLIVCAFKIEMVDTGPKMIFKNNKKTMFYFIL